MGVGFAFERYFLVGTQTIVHFQKSQAPFNDIEKVEGENEQFQHLSGVYAFMAEVSGSERFPFSHEDDAKEVDGCETCKGNEAIDNHLLRGKVSRQEYIKRALN